jgi:predicted Holliday junction resolvase-like endonuclease
MNQIAIMESKIEVLCKQVDDLKKDLALNASMLARQCDKTRVAETEARKATRELQAVKMVHSVEKDAMQTRLTAMHQAAEYWKDKYQEVCKCKDCLERRNL